MTFYHVTSSAHQQAQHAQSLHAPLLPLDPFLMSYPSRPTANDMQIATLRTLSCQYNSIYNTLLVGPFLGTRHALTAYRIIWPVVICSLIISFISELLISLFLLSFFYLSHQSSNIATLSLTMHPPSHLWIQFTHCSHFGHQTLTSLHEFVTGKTNITLVYFTSPLTA